MARKERLDVTMMTLGLRDIGPGGRLSNAALIALAEEALYRFWQQRPGAAEEPDFRSTKFEGRVHEALSAGDAVQFTVTVEKIGGKSIGFSIVLDREKRRAAEVDILWTAVDRTSAEPVALPEALRDWLYQWLP
ncbi:acyl-CoA thioesterase [Rhizobium paknamense]|uniref:Acyl-CoA thioester hydrolase n=1 Tax=Rhizobium paknamense TaxID=1206817 RepID=A0ABU0IA09_9HYPH|nr:thioesterase family protein [Rhizobium paknamense]MDQ0455065.1 acyl-CoA thioester hydrolase [Rhizobium paknamense]